MFQIEAPEDEQNGGKPARRWRPFEQASAFARASQIKSQDEWQDWPKSDPRPKDIPSHPNDVYKQEWKGWRDWLGTGNMARTKASRKGKSFRPFEEARAFARSLHLKSRGKWKAWCKTEQRPLDVPSSPDQEYKAEWKGWGDWLGTSNARDTHARGAMSTGRHSHTRDTRNTGQEWLPFEEARALARSLHLRSSLEWRQWYKTGNPPSNMPPSPSRAYPSDWQGWADWLDVLTAGTKEALLALLHSLRPHLDDLTEPELYTILQQGGSMDVLQIALNAQSPLEVLKELKDSHGETLEQALGTISEETVEEVEEQHLLRALDEEEAEEPDAVPADDGLAAMGLPFLKEQGATGSQEELPQLATSRNLHVVDTLSELAYGPDQEAVEYLVSNRVDSLLEVYMSEGRDRVDSLLAEENGHYFNEIRRRTYTEIDAIESFVVPAGWAFTDNTGAPASPNKMQKRIACLVRDKRRVGNWSGVGSGKTISAIVSSQEIDAHRTLVVTNHATVDHVWKEQIKRAYPNSHIYLTVPALWQIDRERHSYIILNYEKFQGPGRKALVDRLLELDLDFIVLDEIQLIKQRDKDASKRRESLLALLSGTAKRNPDLYVLGMSATPVINTLKEAKALLEALKGCSFPDLGERATINNALMMHRALRLHGFRYRPRYEQEMRRIPVPVTRNDLLEDLVKAGTTPLALEQVLFPAKLDVSRPYITQGTIIYAHYVDQIIPSLRREVEQMGLSVGLYTGEDKSGFDRFCQGKVDVLIGTRPLGTGVDGLQKVCNRLVMLVLPWTGAEYEQTMGRIRRQGSAFAHVEIIVPQVHLENEGKVWSWDQTRLDLIDRKLTLADCVLDGTIPRMVQISQRELVRQSHDALRRWIARITNDEILALERPQLRIPLPPDLREKIELRHGDFTELNRRWSMSRSERIHTRLQQDPSEWYLYHTLYRGAREKWPEHPAEHLAAFLCKRPDWRIGDFGCGECLLRQALPLNTVIELDHVAYNEQVIACDMAHTPLDDACLDAVVYSLSLMGLNWQEYLDEAHRTLKPCGFLYIAEPQKKWQDKQEELKQAMEAAHFHIIAIEQRYDFLYLVACKQP